MNTQLEQALKALQHAFLVENINIKNSIDLFFPCYQQFSKFAESFHDAAKKSQKNIQDNIVQSWALAINTPHSPAGCSLLLKIEHTEYGPHLALQIQIKQNVTKTQLLKVLGQLVKVNHEYIKLLALKSDVNVIDDLSYQNIKEAYLFNISMHHNHNHNHKLELELEQNVLYLIDHKIKFNLTKQILEKWLWLVDYVLSQLQK